MTSTVEVSSHDVSPLFGVGAGAAAAAEAAAGCTDQMSLLQQQIEEVPALEVPRRLQPDVRGIHAAEDLHAGLLNSFAKQPGIFEIERHDRLHLL